MLYIIKWLIIAIIALFRIKVFRIAILAIAGFYLIGFLFEDFIDQIGRGKFLTMMGLGVVAYAFYRFKKRREEKKEMEEWWGEIEEWLEDSPRFGKQ